MSDEGPGITDDDQPDIDERSIAQVGSPSRRTNILVVVFGVAIVGLLLWFVNRGDGLDAAARLTDPQPVEFEMPARREPPELPEPRPAPAIAPVQTPPDPFQIELQRRALRDAEEQRRLAEQRRRAPILILDTRRDQTPSARWSPRTNAQGITGDAADTLASELVSSPIDRVTATTIAHKSHTVAQGSLIRAVLETAIQSDLPGFIRAEVAHDVYSFDGSRLLIPKASRLIGEYRSALVRGQTRVFVIWNRLLRPDGVSILIGSPGTDLLGRVGLAGDLDTHFFKIFGASILLSLVDGAISIGVESVRDSSGSSTTILQNTNSLNRAADIALENSINIPPTIYIDQGTAIQVFVARDLDFFNVTP
ncbi:MAG: type IV secretion system protein VirB10 [Proteobacteria bacterium]|nr:type IV secretion system protein VirB10 [Pseudomonadota bacterium]